MPCAVHGRRRVHRARARAPQALNRLSSSSVREKLARLSQMCTLLNLEAEAEALELWKTGSWRISAAEAKRVLTLRADFRKDKVAALPLAA